MPLCEPAEPVVLGLRRSNLIQLGERVLVAVSGGADSTALLVAMREEGHDIVAVHYDHALQSGSAMAAQHVARLCESLGVELRSERRTAALGKGSLQASARRLRYEFLERAARESGADKVALAHTADDLVEGTIMHLLRGCGVAGLRGMPSRRGIFIRPLLHVWRADVIAFNQRRSLQALDDPANFDLAYARVKVWRELLPALERDRPGITLRFHAAARRAAEIQEQVAAAAARTVGPASASRPAVATLPEPAAFEALAALYAHASGTQPGLNRRQLAGMLRLARGRRGGGGIDLPGGFRFRVVGSRLEVVTRSRPAADAALEVRPCHGCTDRGAMHLKPGLDLRLGHRRPGLRMRPAGGPGSRKLQDIFVDAHVPREERDAWPLVFAGERLAWVPGVAVDGELQILPGQPGLHVTVTRILT